MVAPLVSTRQRRGRHVGLAALGLAVLLGVGARFAQLGGHPIWHDEVYTRIFAAGYSGPEWASVLYTGVPLSPDDLLRFQHTDPALGALDTMAGLARDEPQHPPLYYVLARAWMGLVGDGIGALRALSALMSLLALWALWRLMGRWSSSAGRTDPDRTGPDRTGPGRADPEPAEPDRADLERGRRRQVLAVALLSLSPFFVIYAGEAREYALWSVWVLTSHGALLRALDGAQAAESIAKTAKRWLPYALLTALGLYTCFSHATVILAQILCVAVVARGRLNRTSLGAASALAFAALLFLPWALQLWAHLDAFRASMDWSRAIVVPTGELLRTLAQNLCRPILDLSDALQTPWQLAAVAVCLALLVAATTAFARHGPAGVRTLVLGQLALPVALLLLPDLLTGGIRSMSTRYLLPSLLMVVALVAWWLAGLRRPALRRALTAAVLGVAALGTLRAVRTPVPWTRALSAALPAVAAELNAQDSPLVVADRERHHPGNLMALANLLGPQVRLILLDHPQREALIERLNAGPSAGDAPWLAEVPPGVAVYLFSPIPQLRAAVETATGRPTRAVVHDLFVELWRVTRD